MRWIALPLVLVFLAAESPVEQALPSVEALDGILDELTAYGDDAKALLDVVEKGGKEEKDALFAKLSDRAAEETDRERLTAYARVLEAFGRRAEPVLIDIVLGDGDASARQRAALCLGRVGSAKALDALRFVADNTREDDWLLLHSYQSLRAEAVISIGRIGGPEALRHLDEIWESNGPYREFVVTAMGRLPKAEPGCVDFLCDLFHNSRGPRIRISEALGRLARQETTDPKMAKAVKDWMFAALAEEGDPSARAGLLNSLARLCDEEDIALLQPYLEDLGGARTVTKTVNGQPVQEMEYPVQQAAEQAVETIRDAAEGELRVFSEDMDLPVMVIRDGHVVE